MTPPFISWVFVKENLGTGGLILFVLAAFCLRRGTRARSLPPGPWGLPILGNIFQLGKSPWLSFTEWKAKYGPIMHINAAGQPIIVLNTLEATTEILERKSAVTSDRPKNIVVDVMTNNSFMPFLGQTKLLHHMRKASHAGFHGSAAGGFELSHHQQALILSIQLLTDSARWYSHIRQTIASGVMRAVYGPTDEHSEMLRKQALLGDFITQMTRAAMPGAHLASVFPWMRHIPSRFSPWKKHAEQFADEHSLLFGNLFHEGAASMKRWHSSPSIVHMLGEERGRFQLDDSKSSWLAAAIFAGAQTSYGVLAWWMMAMVVYPETQRRAHDELDLAVGRDRLPTLEDRQKLHYVQAMVKEALRWRPVDPLGLPHAASEDLWYKGHLIPRGAILIPNVWAINRDPELYGPDAHDFEPSRHLDLVTGMLKPTLPVTKGEGHVTYGFGRRTCVGRHIANNVLFINIVLLLWATRIERKGGPDGETIAINVDGSIDDGLVVRPVPFECDIKPRFPGALGMLKVEKDRLSALG